MNLRGVAVVSLAVGVALLSGCSATPSREEVVERFAIELAGALPGDRSKDDADIQAAASNMADESDKYCNDAGFWGSIQDSWEPHLQYVWAASCSTLYDIDDELEDSYDIAIITAASN